MNYNVAALICMIAGVILFYVAFFEFSLIMSLVVLAFFEVLAALLFLFAEVSKRCSDLEKRVRKLEEEK